MFHACEIKFGAINNLSDARYAAAAYARWIGFRLDSNHPRYIEPAKAKEIIDWVSGPEVVAEIEDKMPEELQAGLEVLGINWVQVSNEEAAEAWKNAGYSVILESEKGNADFTLSPLENNQPNHIVDITNLDLNAVAKMKANPPFAININGGDESAPGMRDFADVDEMLAIFELDA